MWGPGGVACIISFICHVPAGMMGFHGLSLYNSARGLGDIYDAIPHGREFLQGLSLVSYTVWNCFPDGEARMGG